MKQSFARFMMDAVGRGESTNYEVRSTKGVSRQYAVVGILDYLNINF